MAEVIQVRQRGVITIPAALREKYNIQEGDVLQVVDMDGALLLSPVKLSPSRLVAVMARKRIEAGLTVEDVLEGLDEVKEQVFQEWYGEKNSEAKTQAAST